MRTTVVSVAMGAAVVLAALAGTAGAQSAGLVVVNSSFSADAWASGYTGDFWINGGGPILKLHTTLGNIEVRKEKR